MTRNSVAGQGARETRLYVPALRVADDSGAYTRLEGRAVPYGTWTNIGWFEESVAAGAFAKSIKETARDLPLLMFHDSRSFPVGRAIAWREEGDGLHGIWELDSSEEAQRAADLADRGFLTGLSVGFTPTRSSWDLTDDWDSDAGNFDRVTRLEARLHEVSICSTPAYADAAITLVRTAEQRREGRQEGRRAAPTPHLDEWIAWRSTL